MKRYGIMLTALIFILTSFTACKKETTSETEANYSLINDPSTDQLESKGTPQAEDQSQAEEQLKAKEHSLQIICSGNDEVEFLIMSDVVSELLGGSSTENNQNINIDFFAGNEQKLNFHMECNNWVLSNTGSADAASDFHATGQADTYLKSGNTVSIQVNQAGISKWLEACDNYSMMLFDTGKDDHELLAGGDLSDVLTRKVSDKTMEVVYTSSDRAVVRLFGEELTTYLKEHEGDMLCINFYLPDSQGFIPDYGIKMGEYSANLYQYSYQKKEDGSYTITPTELIGDDYNTAEGIEKGYSALIHYKGIKDLLSACDQIKVTNGQDMIFLSMAYEAVVTDTQDGSAPIPAEFLPCNQDKTYFYPVTEDYMVIKITIPKCSFYDYSIGTATNGDHSYGPVRTHESSINIVTLISYDEFGIADQKTKIVYNSVAEAMTASATQNDMLPAGQLNGDASDDEIMADFFEQLDQNVFGTALYEEPLYQYYGHFDNTRYFQADWENINYINLKPYFPTYDKDSKFDERGYLTDSASYQYIYNHIEPGLGYSESRENTESITAFYSKAHK